jgi:prepilin-type N-terminal cleavage/methylation domain-containing protein
MKNRGITMIEVLVVMGIFVLVSGFALLFSVDSLRGSTFQGDRDLFVSLLQRARAQAMSNMCTGSGCTDGKPHGVARVGNTYVLFEGSSYATRTPAADSVFTASEAVTRTGDTEVVFGQLSGTTTLRKEFTHTSAAHVSTTTVETNGRIFWTN